MELKVWVEGIQRIVCGVNEKTTCQDVVYALAHATGKTGRFTLIERWRNSERLLAPNEQPLKVLLKWGEHSNDVQFILHWAPLELSSAKTSGMKQGEGDSSSAKNNPSLVSPSETLNKNGVSARTKISSSGITSADSSSMKRKDLSNSAGAARGVSQRTNDVLPKSSHGGSDTGSEINRMSNLSNSAKNSTFTHDLSDSDGSPGKKLKDFHVTSPPPYREPPNPARTIANSPVGGSPASKSLPPYREPPPPNLSMQSQGSRNVSSASVHSSHKQSSHVNSASSSNSASVNQNFGNISSNNTSVSPMDTSSGSKSITSETVKPLPSDVSSSSSKTSAQEFPISNGDGSSNANGIMPKKCPSPISTANPQYQELVRIINAQREKLTAQHAEMTQFDAEIMFWEGKAKEQQRHLDFITKEISRLELYSAQQESQVLSLMHLEEESELVKQESDNLKSEIETLRSEFEKCEKELTSCKNKIGHLTNELLAHRNSIKQRQDEWMRREAATLAEIEVLKQELEMARRETEVVTDLSGSLDMEVNSLEMDLAGKKKQMEKLLNAMKEANLQSLTIQPPEDLVDSGAHHRSGSTRRMIGSPRQLENAAPTSKNPHGVWV